MENNQDKELKQLILKLKILVIIYTIMAIIIAFQLITEANAATIETQEITTEQTATCSVYCYVAEEPEAIIIPKIFIEEPEREEIGIIETIKIFFSNLFNLNIS